MNEDTLNMEIRRFLKKVGITSQRQIEQAVRKSIEEKTLSGSEKIAIKMTLEAPALGVSHCIEDKISLE